MSTVIERPVTTEEVAPSAQIQAGHTRFDMYCAVHKGLRAFMADTLQKVGRTDPFDPVECQESAEQLRSLLHVCAQHLMHENRFVHPAMERRAPGSTVAVAHEHEGHEAEIAALTAWLERALKASKSEAAGAWHWLYLALSQFVAENHEHMLLEERDHNAVLWRHYSDDELLAIHDELVASIAADEMALHMRWMLPQLSHPERVALLGGMRQGMPPEVFATQLDMARPLLNARAWHKLQAAFKDEVVCHG